MPESGNISDMFLFDSSGNTSTLDSSQISKVDEVTRFSTDNEILDSTSNADYEELYDDNEEKSSSDESEDILSEDDIIDNDDTMGKNVEEIVADWLYNVVEAIDNSFTVGIKKTNKKAAKGKERVERYKTKTNKAIRKSFHQ